MCVTDTSRILFTFQLRLNFIFDIKREDFKILNFVSKEVEFFHVKN